MQMFSVQITYGVVARSLAEAQTKTENLLKDSKGDKKHLDIRVKHMGPVAEIPGGEQAAIERMIAEAIRRNPSLTKEYFAGMTIKQVHTVLSRGIGRLSVQNKKHLNREG